MSLNFQSRKQILTLRGVYLSQDDLQCIVLLVLSFWSGNVGELQIEETL